MCVLGVILEMQRSHDSSFLARKTFTYDSRNLAKISVVHIQKYKSSSIQLKYTWHRKIKNRGKIFQIPEFYEQNVKVNES